MQTPPASQHHHRATILRHFGARDDDIPLLLEYNANPFQHDALPTRFPLPDPPYAATWQRYAQHAQHAGLFPYLREKFVQLRLPIQDGISSTPLYRDGIRRGLAVALPPDLPPLTLAQPDNLRLTLHPTLAGTIPILLTTHHPDFVTLLRALAMRSEPKHVPRSMGASLIKGIINWDRLRSNPARSDPPAPDDYQDTVLLLTDLPYSNTTAEAMEMSPDVWREKSLVIRREHECTHFFTHRVLGAARNNMLDELIADFRGITAAFGEYRAEWFLRFVGLLQALHRTARSGPPQANAVDCHSIDPDARVHVYRGSISPESRAFQVLCALTIAGARNLEVTSRTHPTTISSQEHALATLLTLTTLTLEELAAPDARIHIIATFEATKRKLNSVICDTGVS